MPPAAAAETSVVRSARNGKHADADAKQLNLLRSICARLRPVTAKLFALSTFSKLVRPVVFYWIIDYVRVADAVPSIGGDIQWRLCASCLADTAVCSRPTTRWTRPYRPVYARRRPPTTVTLRYNTKQEVGRHSLMSCFVYRPFGVGRCGMVFSISLSSDSDYSLNSFETFRGFSTYDIC